MKLIFKGAEAEIWQDRDVIIKKRVKKSYRIPEIDVQLRKRRTRSEAAILSRASRLGLPVPRVLDSGDFEIIMQFIQGIRLRDSGISGYEERIGQAIASMHSAGIVHGDLTTSNMIERGGEIFLIDFGLGKFSSRFEDFASDIFLLQEVLGSEKALDPVLNAYKRNYSNSKDVLNQLDKIRKRRRYK